MFGKHHEPAQATVLYAEDITCQWSDQNHVKIEFVLEVRTPTGQVFRAKATHHFFIYTPQPQVGDILKVTYDPKSLEVELDLKDDLRYDLKGMKHHEKASRLTEQARRDALLSASPGTPLPSTTSAGGAGMDSLDPELQALMQLEEAERQQAALSTPLPAGFPAMPSAINPQAVMGLAEEQMLRRELEYTGAAGEARILRKQQAGEPVQHFVPFFVEVLVHPDASSFPFECSFTAWVDTSKGRLMEGYTLPVKYDPQNTAHMVFLFPA